MIPLAALLADGAVGGRTVQIDEDGVVRCVAYDPPSLPDGAVRVRTTLSVISPGTEMTFLGRRASNVNLQRRWNPASRLFERGPAEASYPLTFGYRAVGVVVESTDPAVPEGQRIWGNWRHTEYVTLGAEQAKAQALPDELSVEDGADIAQMGPICLNAAAFGEGRQRGRPAVVFGAGPVGLITAQAVRLEAASPVYVVDRLPYRLAVAQSLGFETIDASADDVAGCLKDAHGPEGVPVVWDCTGATAALHEAIRVVQRLGTVVAVGFYQGEAGGLRLGEEFHHNGVQLVSGQIGNPYPGTTREQLQCDTLDLARAGKLVLGGLPRQVLPVEAAAEAFEAHRRPNEVLQVALSFQD